MPDIELLFTALTWLVGGRSDAAEFAVLTGAETEVCDTFMI